MTKRLKEGVPYTLFFLAAIGLLLYNTFGILTLPGIIAALVAIYSVCKKNYFLPAMIGIISASGSFIGQYATSFCPYCTAAAFCFFLGGVINLRRVFIERLPVSIGLIILLTSSMTLFLTAPVIPDDRNPVIYTSAPIAHEIQSNKPLLFLSPTCRSCIDAMELFIKYDPTGENWQPVITPNLSLQAGKTKLESMGYRGQVISAAKPPGKKVPALQINGEVYEGMKEISIKGGQIFGTN